MATILSKLPHSQFVHLPYPRIFRSLKSINGKSLTELLGTHVPVQNIFD